MISRHILGVVFLFLEVCTLNLTLENSTIGLNSSSIIDDDETSTGGIATTSTVARTSIESKLSVTSTTLSFDTTTTTATIATTEQMDFQLPENCSNFKVIIMMASE
jgi:hypothetical protein